MRTALALLLWVHQYLYSEHGLGAEHPLEPTQNIDVKRGTAFANHQHGSAVVKRPASSRPIASYRYGDNDRQKPIRDL